MRHISILMLIGLISLNTPAKAAMAEVQTGTFECSYENKVVSRWIISHVGGVDLPLVEFESFNQDDPIKARGLGSIATIKSGTIVGISLVRSGGFVGLIFTNDGLIKAGATICTKK